jgi:hypothetical protein
MAVAASALIDDLRVVTLAGAPKVHSEVAIVVDVGRAGGKRVVA